MSVAEYGVLNPHGDKYQSVLRQFKESWRHSRGEKNSYTRIVRIVGIRPPRHIQDRYREYKKTLERRGKFTQRNMTEGNERRRWHGTPHECCIMLNDNVHDNGSCADQGCNICSIANTGLLKPSGINLPLRFGAGIYLSSSSSKSDDYTSRVIGSPGPKRGRRALFLCKVACGRGIELKKGCFKLNAPPDGYDSVIGTPGKCAGLNYDELVVYNEAAVLPAYIVVYE